MCYAYYNSEDFASSCDPIRVDLVIDDICVKSKSTHLYMEYRDVVEDFKEYCDNKFPNINIDHVCVQDGRENYKYEIV